jgi:hypothetical protein
MGGSVVGETDFDGANVVRACIRKKGHLTEKAARLSVGAIRRAYPEAGVRAYACRHCGLWHVGNAPGTATRDPATQGSADMSRRKNRRKARPGTVHRGRERRHDVLSRRRSGARRGPGARPPAAEMDPADLAGQGGVGPGPLRGRPL